MFKANLYDVANNNKIDKKGKLRVKSKASRKRQNFERTAKHRKKPNIGTTKIEKKA